MRRSVYLNFLNFLKKIRRNLVRAKISMIRKEAYRNGLLVVR